MERRAEKIIESSVEARQGDAILAAPGRAGRELSIYACANGQRRDGRDLDSGDGGSGGDALGIGISRSLQQSTTLADRRHDLA